MKVYCKYLFAALAATAMLAGCAKEITPPNFENDKVNPASEGYRVIAVSFAPQTKTELTDGFQPKFVDNDSILISNGVAIDTCDVEVEGNVATISTNLTGLLTAVYPYKAAKMNENDENLIDTVIVSTVQDGTFASANICMAKMTGENEESLSFENKTAVFCITPGAGESTQYVEVSADGFEIANDVPTGSTHTSLETIHVAPITTDSVYVSILVPESLTVGSLKFSDGTNEKTITGEKASTAIVAGTLYTVDNENWESPEVNIPEGAVKGVFTVGAGPDGEAGTADDVKVYFSQGNLVATINASGTPTAWKFAAHQYDYLGEGGANKTIGQAGGDVDFFGWSTDATSNNWGIHTKKELTEGYTTGAFKDWGFALGDGNPWRTLTQNEWEYLFKHRVASTVNGTDNARYVKAMVNNISGIILLPDSYEHPTGVADLTSINTENAAFTTNEYDLANWTKMENAGCVFLPTAGCRNGSEIIAGDAGAYWSSSEKNDYGARTVYILSDGVSQADYAERYFGYSVRLVTNVSAEPTPTPTELAYVEITAKYDGEDQPARALKWATKNLAITDSGNQSWKGGSESAVKVPGTNEDVKVGDYFQWGAYAGYCGDATADDKGLLIYNSFTNTKCVGDTGSDSFDFKSPEAGKTYQFSTSWSEDSTSVGISPYFDGSKGEDGEYTKYTGTDDAILDSSDDVAHIILGGDWRMPTSAEFDAMKEATYWVWDSDDMGYYVYAPASGDEGGLNGKQSDGETSVSGTYTKSDALLFFPAAGYGKELDLSTPVGCYRASTPDGNRNAYSLCFTEGIISLTSSARRLGYSVRPVSD